MTEFPVHEDLDVVDGQTISKSNKWWKAVVLYEGFSGQEVAVYLWKRQGGDWTRVQKYRPDRDAWVETRESIERFLGEVADENGVAG